MSQTAIRPESGTARRGDAHAAPAPADADRAHRPMATCFLALLAGALACAVIALAARMRTDPAFTLADAHAWRSGEAMQRIDHAIDVPYAADLHRASAALRYRVLGDLGPQVREGCPGWLFYTDGLRPPPASVASVDAAMNERIAALHRYAQALRGAGVALIVVTVPDKARVETEALCGLRQDPRMTANLTAWQQALTREGVAHVDLLGPLSAARPAFYRTDVHWNARGAQAAANTVAAAVLPLVGGRGSQHFTQTYDAGVQPRVGDLLQLAGLDAVSNNWRPAPDAEMPETIRPKESGGLLDAPPAPQVLLAGSSFSRRGGFADRLGRALGHEVWNASVDDGRFDRALAATWSNRASWPHSLRVVVWEMSEDALSAPSSSAREGQANPTEGAQPGSPL